jgi:hypothetical protein
MMPASMVRSPTDPQRAGFVHSPGDHAITGAFLDRSGLARDHGLVHGAASVPYHAVRGDASTGPHEDAIAFVQLRDRDLLQPPAGAIARHPRRPVGQQPGELGQRALRLGDGAHLDPMPQQHDRDERGELFPERHARVAEGHSQAEREGDIDSQGDQRHHPREPVAELVPGTLDEGPPTVEEDGGAEDRRNQVRARERRRCVTQGAG